MIDPGFTALMVATGMAEIGLYGLSLFVLFRRFENTVSEAASYAIMTTIMGLSFLYQLSFMIGYPVIALLFEALAFPPAAVVLWRFRHHLSPDRELFRSLVKAYPVAAGALLIGGGYLLVQAAALPPAMTEWKDLAQVCLLEQHGGFEVPGAIAAADPTQYPINPTVLPHLLLRFGTGLGTGVFGFLAWMSIGFSTYALARRYAWPPTALTVTLVVVSFPRLIYHATTPGAEIIPAAAALFSILAMYRTVENPNIRELILLVTGILFTISGRAMSLTFPSILAILSGVILFRRHGAMSWWGLISRHPVSLAAAVAPWFVFSQAWLFGGNLIHYGSWTAPTATAGFSPNTGGLQGALANLIRYGLESIHMTLPVDLLTGWMLHFSPVRILETLHALIVRPIFGVAGAATPFRIVWLPEGHLSWFGPLGWMLVLPAFFHALVRGPRRLKANAIALAVYLYLLALIPAWQPGNAQFFMIFFVCGGFCVAFLLPPWRLSTSGLRLVQAACALVLIYACIFNAEKPMLPMDDLLNRTAAGRAYLKTPEGMAAGESAWRLFGNIAAEAAMARRYFGDGRLEALNDLIPDHSRVALVVQNPELIYALKRNCPGPRFFLVPMETVLSEKQASVAGLDFLLFLDNTPPHRLTGWKPVRKWQGSRNRSHLHGALYRAYRKSAPMTLSEFRLQRS